MKGMDVYRRAATLSDEIWDVVVGWDIFAKKTVGEQLVKAVDSIGANLMEGDGRYGTADPLRFFIYARGSAQESEHWIERASARRLIEAGVGIKFAQRLAEIGRMVTALSHTDVDTG
jgi:four helix bundle protein